MKGKHKGKVKFWANHAMSRPYAFWPIFRDRELNNEIENHITRIGKARTKKRYKRIKNPNP